MNSKCIIVKSQSKDFFDALIYKIKEIKYIRYFKYHLNGFYTLVIKCHNYYNKNSILDEAKLYGSYIFLYSIVSIILSELLLNYYEHSISKRIIFSKYSKTACNKNATFNKNASINKNATFNKSASLNNNAAFNIMAETKINNSPKININRLSSISSLLLDENSPFEFSNILYKRRKSFLLDSILKNFRFRNYIFTDYFIDFNSKKYVEELEKIIEASFEIMENKMLYNYIMQFIFK